MVKKSPSVKQRISPEEYIREKARLLPVGVCYRSGDWETEGCANVIVARQHPKGSYTYGHYVVDTYCRGIVASYYQFSLPAQEFKDMMKGISETDSVVEVDYADAHNLIYGAIAFAEKAGITPDKSFGLTRYILEEKDAEGIPVIEFKYGKNGIHHLVADTELEADFFRSIMKKHLGNKFEISMYEGDFSQDLMRYIERGGF